MSGTSEFEINRSQKLASLKGEAHELEEKIGLEIVHHMDKVLHVLSVGFQFGQIGEIWEGFVSEETIRNIANEVGESKPSKKIFEELVKQSQVEASAIVFADDNPDSLSGAKEVGITTFLYEEFDKYLEQLKSVGVKI